MTALKLNPRGCLRTGAEFGTIRELFFEKEKKS